MSSEQQKFADMAKSGNVNLSELEEMSSKSLSSNVSVADWGVCYSSATNQLSQFCTVKVNNSGDTITGIGMVTYNSSGTTMLCLQYTNNITGEEVATSVGTNLYTSSMGSSVLCIVYGWTQNSGNFFVSDTLPVNPC